MAMIISLWQDYESFTHRTFLFVIRFQYQARQSFALPSLLYSGTFNTDETDDCDNMRIIVRHDVVRHNSNER
jgi:hypothetical protein